MYSINRVVPVGIIGIDISAFVGVTLYLLYLKETWSHYGEFSSTVIYLFATCMIWITGNKITNSIYNTTPGGPGKPLNNVVDKAMSTIIDRVNNASKPAETENKDRKQGEA